MPRKSTKHAVKNHEVEVPVETKPPIFKAEEVVESAPVPPVVEVTPVTPAVPVVEPAAPAITEQPVVDSKINQMPEVNAVEEPKSKKSNLLWILWILLAFILGAVAGFGLSKFNFEKKPAVKVVNPNKPVVTPTVEPTKIPEKAFDRATIKVKVLNGSGVKGKAGLAKDYLEGLGYKNVETGNADEDNYTKTEISVKEALKVNLDKIKADVTNKYTLNEKVSTLAADDAFDVLLIIGQK